MVVHLVGPPGGVGFADGATPDPGRTGKSGETIMSQLHGRYYENAYRGNVFLAQAIVTAPVIYSTAAGTGGPLLWNGTSTVRAELLAVGWGISTVTTVAAAIGLTGGGGQTSAPTSTTAIDGRACTLMGGGTSACTPYRVGTVAAAGTFLFPLGELHTGALTVDTSMMHWVDISGLFVLPQYGWISFAASATASTTVGTFGMIWAETPA